jgi:hypothetical protein
MDYFQPSAINGQLLTLAYSYMINGQRTTDSGQWCNAPTSAQCPTEMSDAGNDDIGLISLNAFAHL